MIATILSSITCSFVQKTKFIFKDSKYLSIYSFIVNIIFSIIFCYSYSTITIPHSLWIGLLSFLGADTIYKSLEGKLASHSTIINNKKSN